MKLGIMQPYYLPYLGYISLIKHTDRFILLDTVQFIRHGWIERNRILKPIEGWQYIQMPLQKHAQETKIKDIIISDQYDWRSKTIAQLQHYKKSAPYYSTVIDLLRKIYANEYKSLVDMNFTALQLTCAFLGINSRIEVFSKMGLRIAPAKAPDEWALNICREIPDVTEYWNPPGGMDFFDRSKYEAGNVQLKFQKVKLSEYSQRRHGFESGLSIVDVMMFNDVDEINRMLDVYELI